MIQRLPGLAFMAVAAAMGLTGAIGLAHAAASHGPADALAASATLVKALVVTLFATFSLRRNADAAAARPSLATWIACTVALTATALVRPTAHGVWQALAGEAVSLAACACMLWIMIVLGRCFGVLPAARGLVTSGPYAVVRHPLYVAELTAYAGLFITAPSVWNAAVGAVFVLAQAWRMRAEESVLERAFGPAYAQYASGTPRLVPRGRRPRSVGAHPSDRPAGQGAPAA